MLKVLLIGVFVLTGCVNKTNAELEQMNANTNKMAQQMEMYQKYLELAEKRIQGLEANSDRAVKELELDRAYLKLLADQMQILAQVMVSFEKMGNEMIAFIKEQLFKPAPPSKSPDIGDIIKEN